MNNLYEKYKLRSYINVDGEACVDKVPLHVLEDCRDMWELLDKIRSAMLKKGSHPGWQRAIKRLQEEIEARHKGA